MIAEYFIWVVARDDSGPLFYKGDFLWIDNPILSCFYFVRAFAEDELNQGQVLKYPDFDKAFIEKIKVTCEIV